MNYRKALAAASVVATMAVPAAAQEAGSTEAQAEPAATLAKGTTVYGSDAAALGTVAGAQGNIVVLDVEGRAVPVPVKAIAQGEAGPTLNITRQALITQFDAQRAKYESQLAAATVEGAEVQTADGAALGKIASKTDKAVVVSGENGELSLPREALAIDRQGTLIVRATLEQLKQALAAQAAKS